MDGCLSPGKPLFVGPASGGHSRMEREKGLVLFPVGLGCVVCLGHRWIVRQTKWSAEFPDTLWPQCGLSGRCAGCRAPRLSFIPGSGRRAITPALLAVAWQIDFRASLIRLAGSVAPTQRSSWRLEQPCQKLQRFAQVFECRATQANPKTTHPILRIYHHGLR